MQQGLMALSPNLVQFYNGQAGLVACDCITNATFGGSNVYFWHQSCKNLDYFRKMKKWLVFLFLVSAVVTCHAQKFDPVTLMLAFQQKYAGITHFSGQVRFSKQDGAATTGRFVIDGERFHITWKDGELMSDGVYEWEIMHRSKRIKKRFFDPLITPAVLTAFRFVRLDLTAEPVRIGGTVEQVAIDIDFGSSVAQGSHHLILDSKSLDPIAITTHVTQEGYYEKAELADIKAGEQAERASFSIDFAEWKSKGYTLTDMAKGESDAIWPEERALK
jgi:hypothetical protein